MFVVFDLDGTLANCQHRQHFVSGGNKDWDTFHALCDLDTPHMHIIAVFKAMLAAGHELEIWSGRTAEVRHKTELWLAKHRLNGVPLIMREAGDFTPDHELKLSWIKACGQPPDLVFDDRNSVVAAFRAAGVPVCQVALGDF